MVYWVNLIEKTWRLQMGTFYVCSCSFRRCRVHVVNYCLSGACSLVFLLFVFFSFPLPSFKQGLETLGVLEKMQEHPDVFSSIFCHKPERLSAETLCDLFTIHSSSNVNQVGGANFWMIYLKDVESK